MKMASATGKGSLSRYGKQVIAISMYRKGEAFVGASILLRKTSNTEQVTYVALHLFCQGVELILKGLLLCKDYDKYKPWLRRLGHNLFKTADETITTYQLNSTRSALSGELKTLSGLYSKHLLRYGTAYDLLVAPSSIPHERLLRRVEAIMRLINRELRRFHDSTTDQT